MNFFVYKQIYEQVYKQATTQRQLPSGHMTSYFRHYISDKFRRNCDATDWSKLRKDFDETGTLEIGQKLR